MVLQLTVSNQSTLAHYLVSFTIGRDLMTAFFVGPMPQEILLTPVHLVIDASNFTAFCHHILRNSSPSFQIPPPISVSVALLKRPVAVISRFLRPFAT
jgi:hypothetical protein